MNPFVRIVCYLLVISIISHSVKAQIEKTQSTLISERIQKNSEAPRNISNNWYQEAIEKLREREYFIRNFSLPHSFAAANRNQQLGFLFTPTGYQVKRFDFLNDCKELWEFQFTINGIGRNGHTLLQPKHPQAKYTNQELIYHYPGFEVQYQNTTKGMRQNFIVREKPAGNALLEVSLKMKGNLQASLTGKNGLILYQSNINKPALAYDDLKAWDANHNTLPAHMELDQQGNTLKLVVDDSKAVYPITIDPLNHTPSWTDNGNGLVFPLLNDLSSPVMFGFTVSGAGDVNNDTYDDVVIGSPTYVDIVNISGGTFNLVSVGAAFIYYGHLTTGLSLNPDEALQPTSFAGALFGISVSKAGDINNDGFDDVVIGAPGDHVTLNVGVIPVATSVAVGKVYIYYGNTFDGNLNTEPVVSLSVNLLQSDFPALLALPANPLYGFSVSNAGDVDGDGFGDIAVGSPTYTNIVGLTIGGRVDVYRGSSSGLITTPHAKITGGLIGGLFGYSVSNAGRVNNDLFDDIIAGAPASISLLAVGSAYVFHGSATGITATTVAGANTTLQAPGILNRTLFGFSVSNAGDVNGDGRGDVIVGEPLSLETTLSLQLVAVGRAHIFYGSNTGVQTAGSTSLTSPRRPNLLGLLQGNLLYGFSVSTAGDMNCDGLSDVIVGEPGGTAISLGTGVLGLVSANAISGRAYVYYGRTTGPINSPSWMLADTAGLSVANLLGASVSDAGDVNGDGFGELLVGAPNGTMDFNASLLGIIGSALNLITTSSIGSAYSQYGCLTNVDLDFDNDGIPDAVDLDDDNDGTPDISEYPGLGLTEDPSDDADGDGIPNYRDGDFPGCGGRNASGLCINFDKDGDGIPNSFDRDSDNDGISDVAEAGGTDADNDGVLDGFTDTDNDGLSQVVDANNTGAPGSGTGLGAPDFDGDGLPNSLDLDSDGDGVTDLRETGQTDANNDARVDVFTDADGDGYTDTRDGTPVVLGNEDADARNNFLDIDSDGDGVTDNVEAQTTAGYVLPTAADTDNDGLADVYDTGSTYNGGGINPNNNDGTDNPDYLDTNSDNDGLPDIREAHDLDMDGLPDDDVTPTGTDSDGDGLDDKFDLAVGPNVTTQGMGSPTTPGAIGPLQNSTGGPERDWRNGLFVLPVKLVQFRASYNGTVVKLTWTTATEYNTDHFEVMRSTDGVYFNPVGTVAAAGMSNSLVNYSFTDPSPVNGNNFYQLKMVDRDYRYSQSVVIRVQTGDQRKELTVQPNPVKDFIQIVWNNMETGNYKVDLVNSSGQLITSYNTAINNIYETMILRRDARWKTGLYILRVSSKGGQVMNYKLMIE